MKIVIDIPEDVYIRLKDDERMIRDVVEKFGGTVSTQANLAILNGTLLPEGRFIDADKLKKKIRRTYHPMDDIPFFEIMHIISNAPTVIEGSKKNDT